MFDSAIQEGTWSGIVQGLYESRLKILHPDAKQMLEKKTFNNDYLSSKEEGIRSALIEIGALKREYFWVIFSKIIINPNWHHKDFNNVEA